MPAKHSGDSSASSTFAFVAISPREVKAGGLDGNAIRIASGMRWASPLSAAASWSTGRNLCTVDGEDCRTAVFGKTERTVGWEGNSDLTRTGLVRHCNGEIRSNRYGQSTVTDPFIYPRLYRAV